MSVYLDDGDAVLHHGDALTTLRTMPSASVHCIVTSPPFWALRDYGTGSWTGGDDACTHQNEAAPRSTRPAGGLTGGTKTVDAGTITRSATCGRCGATRTDQQIGLEASPSEWCDALVAVFREARRVLRPDGVAWIEVGDTYANSGASNPQRDSGPDGGFLDTRTQSSKASNLTGIKRDIPAGIKPKDLVGAPWLLAFALRADGWCLRSDVVWKRPNPMPESVTDRPTKAHSMVFLLTKARWVGAEPGRYADLPEGDKRWLAAILDAEGSIAIKRATRPNGDIAFGPQITIINTNAALLAEVQRIVGDVGSTSVQPGTNRPVTYWSTSNTIARDVLLAVYPYLVAKRDQARIAIYLQSLLYHRGNAERRKPSELDTLDRLHQALKAANQCQPQDLTWVPEPAYGKWVPNPYFYDADAIREEADRKVPYSTWEERKAAGAPMRGDAKTGQNGMRGGSVGVGGDGQSRNARSVWTIATEPTPFAHFATFPQALAARCILAGTSGHGCCAECGAPWTRSSERVDDPPVESRRSLRHAERHAALGGIGTYATARSTLGSTPSWQSAGWAASCACNAAVEPCTVLDPFAGSATTLLVARRHGRRSVGIELSAEYLAIAATRLQQLSLLGGDAA